MTMNHSNKDGKPSAESAGGRPLIKRNVPQCDTYPTQSENRVSQGLKGVQTEIIKTAMPGPWLPVLVFLITLASSSQPPLSIAEIKSPDLNLILQRLEEVQHQDPAQSRPYEVRREYKVFRGYDQQPTSEVIAQINFVPPDMKSYKIIQTRGNSRGEKIVRELLDRKTESAKKGLGSEITRANYDFVFLRQENFGVVPEYVLRIVPKRKDKYLLRGQIWIDESTYRIRRIEGVPAKSPSLWIKGIHIILQYAELGGMWVPISFDAIATIRFLGEYTLAGLNIQGADPLSPAANSHAR
jgi:hypothetical protein